MALTVHADSALTWLNELDLDRLFQIQRISSARTDSAKGSNPNRRLQIRGLGAGVDITGRRSSPETRKEAALELGRWGNRVSGGSWKRGGDGGDRHDVAEAMLYFSATRGS